MDFPIKIVVMLLLILVFALIFAGLIVKIGADQKSLIEIFFSWLTSFAKPPAI